MACRLHDKGEMIALAYIRVSTDDQHLGPEAQRGAIAAWAEKNGAKIAGTFEDLGVSGAAPIDERPGMLDALAAVAEHGATVLVVAKRDRLARDVIVAAVVERMFEKAGATIVSADGIGDGDGPEAALMRRILDAFAEYERAIIRARTRAALKVKRARGEALCQYAPIGTKIVDGKLSVDEREAETVELAKQLRGEGRTLNQIAEALHNLGRDSRSGKPYTAGSVRLMVRK